MSDERLLRSTKFKLNSISCPGSLLEHVLQIQSDRVFEVFTFLHVESLKLFLDDPGYLLKVFLQKIITLYSQTSDALPGPCPAVSRSRRSPA